MGAWGLRRDQATVVNVQANHKTRGFAFPARQGGAAGIGEISSGSEGLASSRNAFTAFLPKPNLIIDDQRVEDWRECAQQYPLGA